MTECVTIERDGVTLSALATGQASGPAILLSNSLGATLDMWGPQRELLGQHFRVIGYDTRGHGQSGTRPGDYSFDDLTGDALAVLDHFGVERADFIGLSLGGMTGLGLGLDHGDRIGRIVCACARADAPPPFANSWDDRIAAIQQGGMAAIWPGTLERWLTPDFVNRSPDIVESLAKDFTQTTVPGYIGCARALQTLDYKRRLPQMKRPVLYLSGADDLGAPSAEMHEMYVATPGAEHRDIPDCAHIANLNQPQAFNRALTEFLEL